MPRTGYISVKVYNVRGELVRTLVNGAMTAGVQKVKWDGTSDNSYPVASGVYFYETKYDGQTTINKMALVRFEGSFPDRGPNGSGPTLPGAAAVLAGRQPRLALTVRWRDLAGWAVRGTRVVEDQHPIAGSGWGEDP